MLRDSSIPFIGVLIVANSISVLSASLASDDATSRRFPLSLEPSSMSTSQRRSTSAWNGVTLPGVDQPVSGVTTNPFVPYFVPSGDQSLDDSDTSRIYYGGTWNSMHHEGSVHNTRHVASTLGAIASFTFTGTRVEWFGEKSPDHGMADVYIDHNLISRVDAFAPQAEQQQRLFSTKILTKGSHYMTINVTGTKSGRSRGFLVDIDAFVFGDSGGSRPAELFGRSGSPTSHPDDWSLVQSGVTGVAAMQIAIVTDNQALIIDKVEHNPLSIGGHPAWASLFDLRTQTDRALTMLSNSFCAGGTFLSNGTMLNIGGNPVVADKTGATDFGDVGGLQAVRMFNPCDDGECDMYENPMRLRLASPRWYNTVTRLEDGSAMIIGGSLKGGWINNKTTNNPTIEYFPSKNLHGYNGLPIPSPFLADTINSNLFPIVFTLPDGRVFVAANRDAMIYDWRSNTEQRLPQIPNGVRVTYPMTGTAALLPLSPSNGYTPEVLICGGSTLDDTKAGYDMSSQDSASDQCSRIVLSDAGIQEGWKVEKMPEARIMPDMITLPDGKILIINGGKSGIAGYGNVKNQVGQSNAANPVLTAVLYDPAAPEGERFSRDGIPASNIPRLYHSVATLTPNGTIMIAGSNPNLDRSNTEYGTEYRVEWLSPPYMMIPRPTYSGLPERIGFGEAFDISLSSALSEGANIQISLMDLGFVTHGVHMNARLVILECTSSKPTAALTIKSPPSGKVYPPGPAWLFVVIDGVPSAGQKVLVGDGKGPVVDQGATDNMLQQTQLVRSSSSSSDSSEGN